MRSDWVVKSVRFTRRQVEDLLILIEKGYFRDFSDAVRQAVNKLIEEYAKRGEL